MISHTKKFIFVHINKTGGTSVGKNINKYCSFSPHKHEMMFRKMPNNFVNKSNSNLYNRCRFPIEYYFKFTFVRNPWDRIVSNYSYAKEKWNPSCTDFKDYLTNYLPKYKRKMIHLNQYDWISDFKNNIRVDFIGRFEKLQEDFDKVCEIIKIPQQQLPYINKSNRKHYTEYYDEETKQIVAKKYAKDIEYFGYTFGN